MPITLNGTTGINTDGTLVATGSLTTSSSLTTGTGAIYNGIQASTAVASTSGTSIIFTAIPSWVKRITIMLNGVINSTVSPIIQLGSGSLTTTGYISTSTRTQSSSATGSSTSGFIILVPSATNPNYGTMVLNLLSGNTWMSTHTGCNSVGDTYTGSGTITLSGTLDRVSLTTTGGGTFSAGSVNIIYE
jgi:hypothetical protein